MSRLVPIDLIDPSPWAHLFPHPEDHIARLADDIRERGIQTPLHVYPTGERFELLTGHDRLAAAKRAGLAEVPVEVRSTLTDADERFAYVVKDNTLRKDVDKQAVAKAVLLLHPNWSNVRIALTAGCSEGTVRLVRDSAEASGELRNVTKLVGLDGKERPARTTRAAGRRKDKSTGHGAKASGPSSGIATPTEPAARDDEARPEAQAHPPVPAQGSASPPPSLQGASPRLTVIHGGGPERDPETIVDEAHDTIWAAFKSASPEQQDAIIATIRQLLVNMENYVQTHHEVVSA